MARISDTTRSSIREWVKKSSYKLTHQLLRVKSNRVWDDNCSFLIPALFVPQVLFDEAQAREGILI